MPDLSDWYIFYSGQVENFYLLVLGQVQKNKVNTILYIVFHILINYYEFKCCIEYSVDTLFTRELISGFILFSKE